MRFLVQSEFVWRVSESMGIYSEKTFPSQTVSSKASFVPRGQISEAPPQISWKSGLIWSQQNNQSPSAIEQSIFIQNTSPVQS